MVHNFQNRLYDVFLSREFEGLFSVKLLRFFTTYCASNVWTTI